MCSCTLYSVAASMGLSSFKFVQWTAKDASFCNRVRFGRSGSSKVDDFCTNRKRVCDLIFVPHCDNGLILHRFWDTAILAKIAYFSYPLSHSAPSLPMFPLEFRTEVNRQETRVMGLSSSEDRMIVAGVGLEWYQRVSDSWTVRRSDGRTESIIANTALCILCWRAVKMYAHIISREVLN